MRHMAWLVSAHSLNILLKYTDNDRIFIKGKQGLRLRAGAGQQPCFSWRGDEQVHEDWMESTCPSWSLCHGVIGILLLSEKV